MPAEDLLTSSPPRKDQFVFKLTPDNNKASTSNQMFYTNIVAEKENDDSKKNVFDATVDERLKFAFHRELNSEASVNENVKWNLMHPEKTGCFYMDSSACLKKQSDNASCNVSNNSKEVCRQGRYQYSNELQSCSVEELKTIVQNLARAIEEVSSQLVSLLQENDALQHESNARNIAIEQLLKLAVRQTESDPRPVQMSVVIPESCNDEWD